MKNNKSEAKSIVSSSVEPKTINIHVYTHIHCSITAPPRTPQPTRTHAHTHFFYTIYIQAQNMFQMKRNEDMRDKVYHIFQTRIKEKKSLCLSLWTWLSFTLLSWDLTSKAATVIMLKLSMKSQSQQFCTVRPCTPQGGECSLLRWFCLFVSLKFSCAVPGDINIKLLFGSEATQMH